MRLSDDLTDNSTHEPNSGVKLKFPVKAVNWIGTGTLTGETAPVEVPEVHPLPRRNFARAQDGEQAAVSIESVGNRVSGDSNVVCKWRFQ